MSVAQIIAACFVGRTTQEVAQQIGLVQAVHSIRIKGHAKNPCLV
jgi:hypothetical protein